MRRLSLLSLPSWFLSKGKKYHLGPSSFAELEIQNSDQVS